MIDHVPKPINNASGKIFLKTKNSILGLYGVKKTLKGNQKQAEDNINLTMHENKEDGYIRVQMHHLMTEFFQGSDNNDLIQRMLVYIKTQVDNPKMPESGFSLDKIMHLYIKIHRLVLTRGSSYSELSEQIKNKKVVINPQNKDKECFKWAATEALHHEEIKHIYT